MQALNVGRPSNNTTANIFRLYNGPFVLSEKVEKHTRHFLLITLVIITLESFTRLHCVRFTQRINLKIYC